MNTKEFTTTIKKNLETYPFLMSYASETPIRMNSLNVYCNRFVQFIEFLQSRYQFKISTLEDFQYITTSQLNAFINQNDNSSSKKSKYYALNSLFSYLMNEGVLDTNCMLDVSIPKVVCETKVQYLTAHEVKRIVRNLERNVRAANSLIREFQAKRDLALFSLAIHTGLKPSALLDINIENINNTKLIFQDLEIRLDAKTRKYISCYLECTNSKEGALFIGQNKKRLTVRAYEKILNSYQEMIHRKVNPQLLRSTFARNALQANKSPLIVAKQMGISPMTLMSRYIAD